MSPTGLTDCIRSQVLDSNDEHRSDNEETESSQGEGEFNEEETDDSTVNVDSKEKRKSTRTTRSSQKGTERTEWLEAEKHEQNSLQQHDVYDLVRKDEVPPGEKIIGSRYLYKIKDGKF